jgi:L-histidine N-alpha-methyltransferase
VGSALYDEITRLPEYYPARTERVILDRFARQMVAAAAPDTLVELGSGTADKTRSLLDAMVEKKRLVRYVPLDASESTLRASAVAIATDYGIPVHGVVGDFVRHLTAVPVGGRRLFAFLGGTIGNLTPPMRAEFLATLSATMHPGDTFLVGTDVIKDRARLVRAYDDAAGVTAAFNKNVLSVLNAELGATFDPADFQHVARFDEDNRWIEMRLRSTRRHAVPVTSLGIAVLFEPGEDILTEISSKFELGQIQTELSAAGLDAVSTWTDPNMDFALTLAVRP